MITAAYYFPNFHVDPRNESWHGEGWTEWELTRRATPRFPGHRQPREPLHGYEDEADPAVMAGKIELAAASGLDAFLFDWYWYDGGPYLQRPLEEAFLPASRGGDVRFALMWANHDWLNIHPWKRATGPTELASGLVDAAEFERATDYLIERYFSHPQYLLFDGKPYLSIYELATLVRGLGGLDATADALQGLRRRVQNSGFPDVHLNVVGQEIPVLPQETANADLPAVLPRLGFDSVTSYVWVHHHRLPTLETPYLDVLDQAIAAWSRFASTYSVPYFPNVTVGWDSSPRTVQSDVFDPRAGYPHTNIIVDNSPEHFGRALREARSFMERSDAAMLTINAWNEWTEGSYLEPDTVNGAGYLEQLRQVFGRRSDLV